MQTTTCDRCGVEVTHGEHPFCPHGFGHGMQGDFKERDLNLGDGMKHYTSLAELSKAERRHGLERIEKSDLDRIPSRQQQARRLLEERHRNTERQRHDSIAAALRQQRRG